MAASDGRNGSGGVPGERVAGHAVVGSGVLGPVVRDADGRRLNALLRPREEAERALRSGLGALAPHQHRQELLDVGVHGEGLVLLTSPAVVSTLEGVLESGVELPPGVVVTLLAPVVSALRDAVAAGVHPVPGADAIGLTEEGRPVLLLTEAAPASSAADVVAAVRGLLGRCRQSCPAWQGGPRDHDDLAALEALLYRSAAPLPLSAAHRPEWRAAQERSGRAVEATPGRHRRTHPLDGWRERVRTVVVRRRGPLVTAAVVLVGALVMTGLGPDRSTRAEPAPPPPTAAPTAVTPTPTPTPTRTPVPSPSPSPTPTAATASAAPPPVRPPRADLAPEEAATALLAAADRCGLSDRACAEALTTPDSPIRADWAAAVEALRAPASAVTAVHADVNGASAVVVIGPDPGTTTASVLMIRTEAVWLLRDVFTDGGR